MPQVWCTLVSRVYSGHLWLDVAVLGWLASGLSGCLHAEDEADSAFQRLFGYGLPAKPLCDHLALLRFEPMHTEAHGCEVM